MLLGSFCLRFLLLFVVFNVAFSQSIVKTLPGYSGTLPFKLETGYVGVGQGDEVQLFYYFIESERDPVKDPLVLWLTGGPGCSAFSGLVFENVGPLSFDVGAFNGSLPSFLLNEYSWTKVANIIFLDSPVGTGFSYSTTSKGYYSSDTKTAQETYTFLQKVKDIVNLDLYSVWIYRHSKINKHKTMQWLLNHPSFIKNHLYVAGDSYAGKMIPVIATEISRGNEAGLKPHLNLKGYFLGNPATNGSKDINERIPYAHRMGLISDQYYKLAESSCHGEYISPDPSNKQCLDALEPINMCLENIKQAHILEPKCRTTVPEGPKHDQASPVDDSIDILLPSERKASRCRDYGYIPVYVWANDPAVRKALQIRKGTKGQWLRCNKTLAYEEDVVSAFPFHQYLSKKTYEALVYSGDHDFLVPYLGTLKWIHYLHLTVEYDWRPWYVDGQVAGYTEKYKENRFSLTFATVKGAGHTGPEYKPKECFAMVDRWLSASAL